MTTGSQRHCFLVDAQVPRRPPAGADAAAARGPPDCADADPHRQRLGIVPSAGVAVQPRRGRGQSTVTDLAIALRLNRSGAGARRLTGKTVERRLDHCRCDSG
jgi:hypothetical protein